MPAMWNERVLLPRSDDGIAIEPMTVLDVICPTCHRQWKVPVQQEYTSWHDVAKTYEQKYLFALSQVDELRKELRRAIEPEITHGISTTEMRDLLVDIGTRFVYLSRVIETWHIRDSKEITQLKAKLNVMPNRPSCRWTQDENGIWRGSCGVDWEFVQGGPVENGCEYCSRCGGRIEVTP